MLFLGNREQGLQLGFEIVADLAATPGEMRGDTERLRQVVAHLLSNAIKFTPADGKIVRLAGTGKKGDSGKGGAPLYLGHPEFEGFEVIQTVK